MKEIVEEKTVVGTLYTNNMGAGSFDLLDLNPIKSFTPIKDAEVFYVVDGVTQFAVNIVVKGDFVIVPLLVPAKVRAKYLIEEAIEELNKSVRVVE